MFKPTSPENAALVEKLAGRLASLSMGETISYFDLKRSAPGFKNSGDYWLLNKAREQAERDLGCVFEAVRGFGIKRLPSSEVPDVGLSALRRIRRAANRGKKRLTRVNANSLSDGENRRVVGMVAMLGAVSMIADGRRASAVATVADPVRPIPPQNIIEMFRR
jgi:hypothetical protein